MKPLRNFAMVELIAEKETIGAIEIPDTVHNSKDGVAKGKVVEVAEREVRGNVFPSELSVGDVVLFPAFKSRAVPTSSLKLVHQNDIYAVVS